MFLSAVLFQRNYFVMYVALCRRTQTKSSNCSTWRHFQRHFLPFCLELLTIFGSNQRKDWMMMLPWQKRKKSTRHRFVFFDLACKCSACAVSVTSKSERQNRFHTILLVDLCLNKNNYNYPESIKLNALGTKPQIHISKNHTLSKSLLVTKSC